MVSSSSSLPSNESDIMSNRMILIFLFMFAFYHRPNEAHCSDDRTVRGFAETLKCWNATLDEMRRSGGPSVSAISIGNSKIIDVPANSFSNYATRLRSLGMSNCGLIRVNPLAFVGLTSLRKLNLANNNLTDVHPEWFSNLVSLEELDLTFNSIETINSNVFAKLTNIRLLNLNDNRLKCLEPRDMEPMRSVSKIYVTSNPLTLICRARMTQWFNDKGIKYLHVLDSKSGSWLDRVLWLCAEDDYVSAITETHMRECVLWNFFGQLRLALKTSDSYRDSARQCLTEREALPACLKTNHGNKTMTNGQMVTNIIVALNAAKEQLQKINQLPADD